MYAILVTPRPFPLGLIRIRMLDMRLLPTVSRVAMPDSHGDHMSHGTLKEWI